MSISIHNEPSAYGLSWFCSPRPALVWIGVSGRSYPQSFELWPLCTKPGNNVAVASEGRQMMKYFALNEHYYKLEITTKWSTL